MAIIAETPLPGQIVRVRMRQYLVEDVVGPPDFGDSTLVRMACLDDDAQGQPLEVLWETELDREILTGESWQSLAGRGFDPPRLFSAYLHTMRWNCVTATDPRLFQSPFRAGIQLHAYQLEPLRILVATDAAREGLNLQCHCWNLFHFDVPWNPSRMGQRNGRIDRKLQPQPEVFCHSPLDSVGKHRKPFLAVACAGMRRIETDNVVALTG